TQSSTAEGTGHGRSADEQAPAVAAGPGGGDVYPGDGAGPHGGNGTGGRQHRQSRPGHKSRFAQDFLLWLTGVTTSAAKIRVGKATCRPRRTTTLPITTRTVAHEPCKKTPPHRRRRPPAPFAGRAIRTARGVRAPSGRHGERGHQVRQEGACRPGDPRCRP